MTSPLTQLTKSPRSLLRFLAGCVILWAVLWYVDLRQFVLTLLALEPASVAGLVAMAGCTRLIRAWKWNLLLRAQRLHISQWQALRLSLISHFAGSWTPGQVGGDAYRVVALRPFGRTDVVLTTVLIERYAGLCAVSLVAFATLPFTFPFLYRNSPWVLAVLTITLVLVAAVVPCMLSQRLAQLAFRAFPRLRASSVGRKIRQCYVTLLAFRHHRQTLIVFGLGSLVEVISNFVTNYLAARAVGLDVSLTYFLLAMPLVHLLLRIPVAMQGVGVQEGCFAYALVVHGFTAAEGLAVSVVQRALEWLMCIVPGGILWWFTGGPSAVDQQPSFSSDARLRSGRQPVAIK